MTEIGRTVHLDFETYSETDIKSAGSFRYMEDPNFEILLLAYAFDDEPVKQVDFTAGEEWPEEFLSALRDPDVTKVAWNCMFERYAIFKGLGIYCPPEEWLDAMHVAAQCGLPASLDGAGKALQLDEDTAKMKEGKALIKYFCAPCKPTKTNGQRTRNLPEHAPEKWATFKEYSKQDVVSERAILNLLTPQWLPNDDERRFWSLDAKINERGVRIDTELARQAVAMDKMYKNELTFAAVALTGMENPKSVAQIKQWLLDQEGQEVPSLNKKVVADVVANLKTPEARQFMAIRSELAKSSTSKFEAMTRVTCPDGHAKGCFQFYGANRTGRFAGRHIQFQNLSKNEAPDIGLARELVKTGDYDGVKVLFGSVSKTLSELVRPAIIPEEGHQLLVSDFSAIEARVIAWLAGEQWRLDVFENGGDIYCQSASQMFKVPVEKHGVNGHLRQKGKVAELACIAEGQLVLTDTGLVPIEKVTRDMKVWDGENWVPHEGLVYRGEKEVITYEGLTATPDHLVWIEGESGPVQFGVAASCGAHLLQTGDGWNTIRVGGDYQPRKTMERSVEPLLCPDEMHRMWISSVASPEQSNTGAIQRMPALLAAEDHPALAGSETDRCEAEMREPKRCRVSPLRCPRNQIQLPECNRRGAVSSRNLWPSRESAGARPYRHERRLCSGESEISTTPRESAEQTHDGSVGMGPEVLALRLQHGDKKAVVRDDPRGDYPRRGDSGVREAEELENHRGKVRVYDLRNAGPNHRFTVSGVLVHNCGYGGGVNALKAFGADKMGMTNEEMAQTVDMWRAASPKICELWRTMERAAIRCIVHRATTRDKTSGIAFQYEKGIMWMVLPSGRRLAYFGAQYGPSQWNPAKNAISYMGTDQKTKKWTRVETWGGKLVENCTQAVARDCLRESMLALDDAGYDIRAHVHDEVIVTEPLGGRSVEEMSEVMGRPIPWAAGLPLRADGYCCPFYIKD